MLFLDVHSHCVLSCSPMSSYQNVNVLKTHSFFIHFCFSTFLLPPTDEKQQQWQWNYEGKRLKFRQYVIWYEWRKEMNEFMKSFAHLNSYCVCMSQHKNGISVVGIESKSTCSISSFFSRTTRISTWKFHSCGWRFRLQHRWSEEEQQGENRFIDFMKRKKWSFKHICKFITTHPYS